MKILPLSPRFAVLTLILGILALPQGLVRAQTGPPLIVRPGGTAQNRPPPPLPAEFILTPREPAAPAGALFLRNCRMMDIIEGIVLFTEPNSAVGVKIRPVQVNTSFNALFVIECPRAGMIFQATVSGSGSSGPTQVVKCKQGANALTFTGQATRARGASVEITVQSAGSWKLRSIAIKRLS